MRKNNKGYLATVVFLASMSVCYGAEYPGCGEGETVLPDAEEPAAEQKIGSLSEEEIQDFLGRQAAQGACGPWYSNISLGAQLLPKYSEEGRNEGFKEQRFFGQLKVDGRWEEWNFGIVATFRGAPVVRNAETEPGVVPTEFNDIADTLSAGPYISRSLNDLFPSWKLFEPVAVTRKVRPARGSPEGTEDKDITDTVMLSSLRAVLRVQAITREELDPNQDSVDAMASLGFSYHYDDFKRLGYRNGLSRGYAAVSAAWFENYAGFGGRTRVMVDSAYRVFDRTPVYVGLSGNFGEGPDELSLYIIYAFKSQKFTDFF